LLTVLYVPFLRKIFGTMPLTWVQWEIILPLLLVPSLAAETVKIVVTRKRNRKASA